MSIEYDDGYRAGLKAAAYHLQKLAGDYKTMLDAANKTNSEDNPYKVMEVAIYSAVSNVLSNQSRKIADEDGLFEEPGT